MQVFDRFSFTSSLYFAPRFFVLIGSLVHSIHTQEAPRVTFRSQTIIAILHIGPLKLHINMNITHAASLMT